MKTNSIQQTQIAIDTSSAHSLEVTGLGIIAALLVAIWGLVADGTLPLSQYLVFAGMLSVGAGALVWRILAANQAQSRTNS